MTDWSHARDDALCQMWHSGVVTKTICFELDCSYGTLSKHRRRLGLPARRHFERQQVRRLQVMMTRKMYDAAMKVAFVRHKTVASYVRALIRNDIEAQRCDEH